MNPEVLTSINDLPPQLIILKMTYIPFSEVKTLCTLNSRLHDICTNKKYAGYWETVIKNVYDPIYLPEGIEYNYLTYVRLIDTLPDSVQSEIYLKQKDWDNYYRLSKRYILQEHIEDLKAGEIDGKLKVLDVSRIKDSPYKLTGIRLINKPSQLSRVKGVEGLPIVSDNPENYDVVLNILGPDYSYYLNEFHRKYIYTYGKLRERDPEAAKLGY